MNKSQQKRHEEKIDRELNPETYEHNFKTCCKCKQEKPLNKFPICQNTCLKCDKEKQMLLMSQHPERKMFYNAKRRSIKKNLEFSITIDDIKAVWTNTCPIYHIPLKNNQGKPGPDSFSLDRIDNSKGYVPGNIAIVSNKFNAQKSDLTPTILKRMLAYIQGLPLP